LGLFTCCKYNNEKDLLDISRQQVKDLEIQCTDYITQIQELKAMYDYQTGQLEKTITTIEKELVLNKNDVTELEKQNASLKREIHSYRKKFASSPKPKQPEVKK
jgi:predicted  nucleic acid-binding Zn-ribbon protein